jgi:deoxyribose-phosphate aldolase
VEFVSSVKQCCLLHSAYLKTIIQSDELEVGGRQGDEAVIGNIARLTRISFAGGSDLVKTSTGKGNGKGASLEAAATICLTAKCFRDQTNYQEVIGHAPGAKYSGGISDTKTARDFIRLHREILGDEALCCEMIRFGASRLVGTVLAEMLTCDSELAQQLAELEVDGTFFADPGSISISRSTNY